MSYYNTLSQEELNKEYAKLVKAYEDVKGKGLSLNMARGKPGSDQLAISKGIIDVLKSDDNFIAEDGTDCRNYGLLDGIPEAKEIMANIMDADPEQVIVFGNSSLNVMYDSISRAYTHGVLGGKPWCKEEKIKWLCPAPGYDRHFLVTQHFGFELITVPLLEDGPDMDMIENLVSNDPAIKGIWCVPKYSNPTGTTYSDEVVKRFARLKPAAADFRIFWDNAYTVHHLFDEKDKQDKLLSILEECEKAGNPDLVYVFASTSKVTFPGSGIAAMAASANNISDIKKQLSVQTIGHDKMNMLRHARFFKDADGLRDHMKKHAALLRPKFEAVLTTLDKELSGLDVATWTNPNGGYFVSLNVEEGCAKKVVLMCKEAGVVLTGAGATFPYGKDPKNNNIRIAPSFPSPAELKDASYVLALCTKIAAIEKILGK